MTGARECTGSWYQIERVWCVASGLGGRDFARFLRYSVNSANELEYHITFVRDAGIVTTAEADTRLSAIAEVGKMLTGLIKRIDEDSD